MSTIFISPVARSTPFDNTANSFTSTEVQSAIEEARTTAINRPRFTIVTTFNSILSNNQWMGYNEQLPGDMVPVRLPVHCVLKEITMYYQTGSDIDGRLQLYKNGFVDPTNIFHTETFTNQADGRIISGLSQTFAPGDFIAGRWKDDGDNPSDVALVYFFQIT